MMGRAAALALLVGVLSLGATAAASGSFSVRFDPLSLRVEANVEQEVSRAGGWTVYAGSGFQVSPGGIEKLQPYTLACRELDILLAYTEACVELRAPLVGQTDILRFFFSLVW